METDGVLSLVAGAPLTQIIRAKNLSTIWDDISTLEVRAQLREDKSVNSNLIVNLHDYMTWVFDGPDLVITLQMNGSQTREVYVLKWGIMKEGYFNIIISDAGVEDTRSVVVPTIKVKATTTTTDSG